MVMLLLVDEGEEVKSRLKVMLRWCRCCL